MSMQPDALLRHLFDVAVQSVAPARIVAGQLPPPPRGRTVVVGAGKAAAAMASAVEAAWAAPLSGLVVVPHGHAVPCTRITVVEAAHPVPDAASSAAAARVLELVTGLGSDDLVLCLLSGGGSALLAAPAPGVTLADKRSVTRQLLRCGASIGEINCVRKRLSAIKGGRLAVASWPARVVTLAISDVPGDDPAVIASGPTSPDHGTCADALAIVAHYGIELAPALRAAVAANETPKPGDPRLARAEVRILATAGSALAAAAAAARVEGVAPVVLGDAVQGEARAVAVRHAELARGAPSRPCVLLSGGETTVVVRGRGRGGRNAEYALALALELAGAPDVWAIACDTDGIDGTEHNAGARVRPDTLVRARARGVDAAAALADNDAYSFFAELDDLIVTGATRTNVGDFRAILCNGAA